MQVIWNSRSRTRDTRRFKPLLYQLSYVPNFDSNRLTSVEHASFSLLLRAATFGESLVAEIVNSPRVAIADQRITPD